MASNPVKVFLVEDSPVALNILERILSTSSDISIVGKANNGITALEQIPKLKPDVVCTDILMGKMDGLELTKKLMASFPLPILAISDVVTENDTTKIGQLLEAGIVDVFPKPKTGFIEDYEKQQQALITKLKILSGVKVFTKKSRDAIAIKPPLLSNTTNIVSDTNSTSNQISDGIVLIGVSTGGPTALKEIISNLPANFSLPIVCTQHISPGFLNSLISWLALETPLKIKIASIGEKPLPGFFYFAPEHYHLEISSSGKFAYSSADPFLGHCPSITLMFKSFAKFYQDKTIGVLLTGMGRDGVAGIQTIYDYGGLTVAQNKASSVIFGMPQEAIAQGVIKEVLPLKKIAAFLMGQVSKEVK